MSVDGVRVRFEWLAEFVEVRLLFLRARADFANIRCLYCDVDPAREAIKRALFLALDPHMQVVVTRRNAFHAKCALCVSKTVVRRRKRDNYRAHLRMDVAENIGDALSREDDAARGAGLIESEIEAPPIEERKHVVKEWVGIWKSNTASHRHNQQVRSKHLVFLQQSIVAGSYEWRRAGPRRVQPDHCRTGIFGLVRRAVLEWDQASRHIDLLLLRRDRLRADAARAENQEQQPVKMSMSITFPRHQNVYPAPIPITSLKLVGPVLKLVQRRLYSIEKIRYALGL